MKKILAFFLAAMLVFAFGVTAMAEDSSVEESFVQSPTVDEEVVFVDAKLPDADGSFELIVTTIKNKANLTDEQEAIFDAAYNALAAATDLSAIIENIGPNLGTTNDALAVGAVFFTHVVQISRVALTGEYIIEVKCAGLDKFAGLINYSDNEWSIVGDAKVNESGNLVFTTDKLDAFAVLLDVSEEENTSDVDVSTPETDAPTTGDEFPWLIVILGAVAVVGIVAIAVTGKKKR